MRVRRNGDTVEFASRRVQRGEPPARFGAAYRPTGEPATPEPNSLTAFLVENYRAYAAGRTSDAVYYVDIDHKPWPIQPAELSVASNTLFEASGFDAPTGDPLVQYAGSLGVGVGRPRRVVASGRPDAGNDGAEMAGTTDDGVDVPVTGGSR
jgi:hypothetical protein